MKKATSFTLVTILCLLTKLSSAQDCSSCNIALIANARDEFQSSQKTTYDEATSILFEHDYNYWSSYSKGSSTGFDAAFKIFSLGFSNSNSESQKKFESLKENYKKNHTLSQEEQITISTKISSKTSYEAWEKCIEKCYSQSGIFLKSEGNNENEFILSLLWVKSDGISTTPQKITNIAFSNCKFVRGNLIENAEIAPWNSLIGTFQRLDKTKDAIVTVSVAGLGNKTITISKSDALVAKKFRKIFYKIQIIQMDGELEIYPSVDGVKQGSTSFYYAPYDLTRDGLPSGELNMKVLINTPLVSSKGFGLDITGTNPTARNRGYCRFRYNIIMVERLNDGIKETLYQDGSFDHAGTNTGVIFHENIYLTPPADAIVVKSTGEL
jgi:hypothetical protein